MKLLLIAAALGAFLMGCQTRNAGSPGDSSSSEPDRSKAYYLEGENDRHNSKAGHMLHW
ncbi:MAG TPA: hypothetical protein VGF13_08845 [Verrucomicrobiae bacterium]|jgi:hypothetical protein